MTPCPQTSGPGSRWRVRVTQVPCGEGDSLQVPTLHPSPPQAPPGCGQYYTEPRGNISSLNWPDGQYPRYQVSCPTPLLATWPPDLWTTLSPGPLAT